jgi:hypothetical protein
LASVREGTEVMRRLCVTGPETEPPSQINGRSSPTENARFFDQLGSPGGAAKTGPLPDDTGCVASYVTSR